MIRYLLFAAIIIGAISFIVYHVTKFILSINVGKNKLNEESERLRKELREVDITLIPFTWNDFLTLSAIPEIEKNLFTHSDDFMLLQTVFSEPMLKVGRKKILGSEKEVVLAITDQDEILFHDYGKDIQVYYNQQYFGFINQIGNFVDEKMNVRANLHLQDNNEYRPIELQDKVAGVVANPSHESLSVASRNYKPIIEDLDDEGRKIAMVMILANQLFG